MIGDPMIRTTRLVATLAFAAGLTASGAALAQTQPGSAAPPAASAQPATAPARSTPAESPPPSAQSETPATEPWDPNSDQRSYSVDPPPDGTSGIYLPAVVGGYAKSVAGCVVVGCDNGPQVGGAPAPSSSAPSSPGSDEPPPANPGSSDPR